MIIIYSGRARRKGKKKLGQEDTGKRNDRQGEGVEAVSPASNLIERVELATERKLV